MSRLLDDARYAARGLLRAPLFPDYGGRLFVGYGVVLAVAGVGLGLVAAVGVAQLISSLLFEVHPYDPLTYATVVVLLTVVAAVASYWPAHRASSVDPAEALAGDRALRNGIAPLTVPCGFRSERPTRRKPR